MSEPPTLDPTSHRPHGPPDRPCVLVLAGLDPTGGAGLQADIEAINCMGAHPLPVITAITAQDTVDVKSVRPVDALEVISQARAVLDDVEVAAVKLGLLGSTDNIQAVHTILADHPALPVVMDPVCASGAGTPLVDDEQLDAMVTLLFPRVTVLTPNTIEARLLAPEADSVAAAAQELMSYGVRFVLITGTHENQPRVVNRLYGNLDLISSLSFERLANTYHGSGCTLASALAGLLAHDVDVPSAAARAQEYAWRSLQAGYRIGRGQHLPNRFHGAVTKARREPRAGDEMQSRRGHPDSEESGGE